jgi:2-succinyl-6-hydroxy-2,4-cyclohexadiene-1-carboxylate synthase
MREEILKLENTIGINVRYSEKPGTAVVFLHFSTGNLNMWDCITPMFEDSYRAIVPELRGHGKSDKPLSGYHVDDMANDIYLLLKKLDIEKCHIVGSSLGAEVGLSVTSSHPEMVLSLVCEGALYNEFGEFGMFSGSHEEIESEKEKKRNIRRQRKRPSFVSKSEYVEEEIKALNEEGLWNECFRSFTENSICMQGDGKYSPCTPQYVSDEYTEHYWNLRLENYYKNVKCPVLLLPSEDEWKDERVMEIANKFGSMTKGYEIRHIEGSIHAAVWMQFPETAGRIVHDFIERAEKFEQHQYSCTGCGRL